MTEIAARPDRWWTSRFFLVTVAAVLGVTAIIVGIALAYDNGHLVYLTDDPGIHLSVVHDLVNHGTWGVVPGKFESASSSPGWTLLLAAPTALIPAGANLYPLLLNLVSGIALVALFTTNQRLVGRGDRSWSMVLLAVVVGVFVLYIPALALLGMEHTLQCALVLLAVILLERVQRRALTMSAIAPLLVVLFLATAVRFETLFLACGMAVAFVVGARWREAPPDGLRASWTIPTAIRAGVLGGIASGLPVLVMGAINHAFGRRFLPNSIVMKSDAAGQSLKRLITQNPMDTIQALNRDPLAQACALIAAGYLIWVCFGGPRRNTVLAVAFLITALLHARFADFGWYERYQEYLVVLGVYLVFQIVAEIGTERFATAIKVTAVVGLIALSAARFNLTLEAPRASSNTYRQRYQLGRFLEAEYAGETVATTELGYASLDHRGPLLDVGGIGSHEFLETIKGPGLDANRFAALLNRNDAQVLVLYSVYPVRPKGWKPVGIWTLDERVVDAPGGRGLVFFAPPGAKTRALHDKLEHFESQLPSRVRVFLSKQ